MRFNRVLAFVTLAALSAVAVHSAMPGSAPASGQATDPGLDAFRAFAARLSAARNGGGPNAWCEYRLSRPSNSCSQDGGLEHSIRLHGDGRIELLRFRSFVETHELLPGEFRGQADTGAWRQALSVFAAMAWQPMPPGLPMPSHSDNHQRLILSDGETEAGYTLAGNVPPMQDRIDAGFSLFHPLALHATDTVWALSFAASKARSKKKGLLEVEATWRLHGRIPVSLTLPARSDPAGCGAVTLAWFEDVPEKKGVTPLPPEIRQTILLETPSGAGTTRALATGKSLDLVLRFALPPGKGRRLGKVTHLGATVTPEGEGAPVPIALFSPPIRF